MPETEEKPPLADVAESFRIDEARLHDWLEANVDSFAGPLAVRQFTHGQSNPTYLLDTPGKQYVLRRKPPGKLLRGAHAVDREARVMGALGQAGFPVPKIYGLCTDDDVIGTWFYVMEMVAGRVFLRPDLSAVARGERPQYFDALNEVLATLHNVDPASVGLSDYGKTGGYVERQIGVWRRQYHENEEAGRDAHLDRLAEWLPANIPVNDETTIVHGDYRIDNVIFHPEKPDILAVLDWELSTLGHPLADFTYHLMMYRVPHDMRAGLAGLDLNALNLPDEASYVADYCRRTGRDGIAGIEFYLAFNFFRFAAICHGIKGRLIRGNAASPDAVQLVETIPRFAEIGWQCAQRVGA